MRVRHIVVALGVISIAGLVGVLGGVEAGSKDEHQLKGKTVSLKGEVLDLHCYMLHPDWGQGKDHAECAQKCINKGLPAGFLADGEVYLLLGPKHGSAKFLVAEHAGYPVTLKGMLVAHSGVKAIQVSEVKPLKGAKAKSQPVKKTVRREDSSAR